MKEVGQMETERAAKARSKEAGGARALRALLRSLDSAKRTSLQRLARCSLPSGSAAGIRSLDVVDANRAELVSATV